MPSTWEMLIVLEVHLTTSKRKSGNSLNKSEFACSHILEVGIGSAVQWFYQRLRLLEPF